MAGTSACQTAIAASTADARMTAGHMRRHTDARLRRPSLLGVRRRLPLEQSTTRPRTRTSVRSDRVRREQRLIGKKYDRKAELLQRRACRPARAPRSTGATPGPRGGRAAANSSGAIHGVPNAASATAIQRGDDAGEHRQRRDEPREQRDRRQAATHVVAIFQRDSVESGFAVEHRAARARAGQASGSSCQSPRIQRC